MRPEIRATRRPRPGGCAAIFGAVEFRTAPLRVVIEAVRTLALIFIREEEWVADGTPRLCHWLRSSRTACSHDRLSIVRTAGTTSAFALAAMALAIIAVIRACRFAKTNIDHVSDIQRKAHHAAARINRPAPRTLKMDCPVAGAIVKTEDATFQVWFSGLASSLLKAKGATVLPLPFGKFFVVVRRVRVGQPGLCLVLGPESTRAAEQVEKKQHRRQHNTGSGQGRKVFFAISCPSNKGSWYK